ncbi:MAG: hypothetical protein WAK55_09795 [Xanthobacteraceae bacterium]
MLGAGAAEGRAAGARVLTTVLRFGAPFAPDFLAAVFFVLIAFFFLYARSTFFFVDFFFAVFFDFFAIVALPSMPKYKSRRRYRESQVYMTLIAGPRTHFSQIKPFLDTAAVPWPRLNHANHNIAQCTLLLVQDVFLSRIILQEPGRDVIAFVVPLSRPHNTRVPDNAPIDAETRHKATDYRLAGGIGRSGRI